MKCPTDTMGRSRPDQAFCDSPTCTVLSWNPVRTLDENLLAARVMHLPDWLK